jgi:hypothetical protein
MTYMTTHTCQSESSNARLEEHHGTLQGDNADWANLDRPALRIIVITDINASVPGINGAQLPELRRVMLDVSGLGPRFTVNVSAASGDVVLRSMA